MRRVSLWVFTIASVLFWAFALVMALLEVVHLAHGQYEHVAGTFAMQAAMVAAVCSPLGHASPLGPVRT